MYFSIISKSGLECKIGEIIPISEFNISPPPVEDEILISNLSLIEKNLSLIFIGGIKEYKINGRTYPMGDDFVFLATQNQDSSISLLVREAIGKEISVLQGKDKKRKDHWWPVIKCNTKEIENETLINLKKQINELEDNSSEKIEEKEEDEDEEFFYY